MYKIIILVLGMMAINVHGAQQAPAKKKCKKQKAAVVESRRQSVASQKKTYTDSASIDKAELVNRCMTIVSSPHFYDQVKKIHAAEKDLRSKIADSKKSISKNEIDAEVERRMDKEIRHMYMGIYQRHYLDWQTHEGQLHKSSHKAKQLIEQKYAQDNSSCVLL